MNLAALFCSECIAAMDSGEFSIYVGLSIIATLFFLRRTHRQFHRSRLIADMPTSRIRSASQGFTELVGIARKDEHPNLSPLSGELCLWWRYTIEEYKRSGKNSHWVTIEKKQSSSGFLLEDMTGTCYVEPDGAEISCYHTRTWYGNTRRPIGATHHAKTQKHPLMAQIGSFGRRYRYTEHLIKEGDPLYALGHFSSHSNPLQHLSLEQMTGDILRSWKQDFSALVKRFDINKDGQLNTDEWQLARHAARWQAKEEKQLSTRQPTTHSISEPAHRGLPFIISSHEQSRLGTRFRNGAILAAISFLLAGTAATWLLSSRFLSS